MHLMHEGEGCELTAGDPGRLEESGAETPEYRVPCWRNTVGDRKVRIHGIRRYHGSCRDGGRCLSE